MGNNFILILAIIVFLILLISLFFLFKRKNVLKEEEEELLSINEEIVEVNEAKVVEEELKEELPILVEKKSEIISDEVNLVDEIKLDDSKSRLSISISPKTEQNLLVKIKEFEDSRAFLKKEVNLNYLAKEFDTNTKYLSEIIKSYKNKNFNQYLNELRIDCLLNELNTNEEILNTKVSYLASDFGFNSHSSFSTVFTQYVGKTPSEYIKSIKDKK